jgi:hypothetical protein
MVEIHCGNTGMKCVACQKYIHDNVKFASLSLYLIYNADTNILSHNTNYHPFTGLSYRNNDDEDLIMLDKHFELHLREGMFLSFNLPENHARRFCYPMKFYVGSFETEAEGANVDEEEEEDDDDELQVIDHNGCVEMDVGKEEGMCEYVFCLFAFISINTHLSSLSWYSSFYCINSTVSWTKNTL